jgi:predicted RNA binding protein YcfA (HicA-like mRNA interferase family)
VEVLADLGYLHLDNPRRGDELGEDEEAFAYDFRAERRREDLDSQLGLVSAPLDTSVEFDLASAAAQRQRVDRERIAERLGGGTPPPPPNPDVHAWYQPIHYFAQGWGIFVRETGIQTVAEAMAPFIRTTRDPLLVAAEAQRMAHVALRLHETFHHKIESAAIRMETVSLIEKYKPYDDAVFRPLFQARSTDLLEEGLANSWMFRQRDSDSDGVGEDVLTGCKDFLEWWIPLMPFAYGRGIELSEDFEMYLYHLTEQLRAGQQNVEPRYQLWAVTTHLLDPLHNRRSPHYIVVRRGNVPYLPHTAGPPKELSLTNRDLERCLVSLGWQRIINGGRHPVKFVKSGQRPIPVPRHAGAMPTGTLHAIAKQAGFRNVHELVSAAA